MPRSPDPPLLPDAGRKERKRRGDLLILALYSAAWRRSKCKFHAAEAFSSPPESFPIELASRRQFCQSRYCENSRGHRYSGGRHFRKGSRRQSTENNIFLFQSPKIKRVEPVISFDQNILDIFISRILETFIYYVVIADTVIVRFFLRPTAISYKRSLSQII